MISTVFFGTEHFGAGMLAALLGDPEVKVLAVVTQPDRPVGRKQEMTMSPVKELALKHSLTILQPEKLKTFADEHTELKVADLFIVCQYGLIIPQSVLDMPQKGTINVHTSLLPKYRGASPIQAALINGETETGVTIMQMDAKMDHGAILTQQAVPIDEDDTYLTLSNRMMPIAAKLLLITISEVVSGRIVPQEQDHDAATTCSLLSRDDGKLDFSQSAAELYNLYRGTYPWPGIWTTWEGKRLKLLAVSPVEDVVPEGVVDWKDNRLLIGTNHGSLRVLELQLEGKKPLTAPIFIQGNKMIIGAKLG